MLKAGDTVTLGCGPTVKIGESFVFLKPHATIQRKLSDDIESDLQEIGAELRTLLMRSLRIEIIAINDIYSALGEGSDLEALVSMCEKEIGNVEAQASFGVAEAEGGEKASPLEIDAHGNIGPKDKTPGVKKKGSGKFAKPKAGVKKKQLPKG